MQLMARFSKNDRKKIKYVLFLDKNVTNKKIDSIKNLLLKEIEVKTFIVKNYKENKWN